MTNDRIPDDEVPDEQIVEVFAAANAIEAYGLADALEEQGIRAKVVNDEIGQAGGGLPLGWSAAPRVWVHQRDRAAAERLIDQWAARKQSSAETPADEATADAPVDNVLGNDDAVENDPSTASDEETALRESAIDQTTVRSALSKLLQLVGVFAILIGCIYALMTYLTARSHPAEAQGELIEVRNNQVRSGSAFRTSFRGLYRFEVDGHQFTGLSDELSARSLLTAAAPVHYDPRDPTSCIIGPLPEFWPPLVAGLSVGCLLLFIVWRMG